MAAKKLSPLVLDGNIVKLRIEAEREFSGNHVHIDWVRFTAQLRNAPIPPVDVLFPRSDVNIWDVQDRNARLVRILRDVPDSDWSPAAQAFELAEQTAAALGPDFSVDLEVKKGMDFYKSRWSITLSGVEVGWVGFLASSDSPRKKAQAKTVHASLYGAACTFAQNGWNMALADLVDASKAKLTRADLALDFFDGIDGGIDSVRADYRNGLCNVGGRKLKFSMVGDWENEHDRSVYIGSRESGKCTNVYEKGDQLYGHQTNNEWIRFELRYGNKLRVLSTDMLRRPDDFFAGASAWHNSVLLRAVESTKPENVTVKPRLQIETVQAECTRNVRWIQQTAASSMAVAFSVMDTEKLWDLIGSAKLPGRLQKFNLSQIKTAMGRAVDLVLSSGAGVVGQRQPVISWT